MERSYNKKSGFSLVEVVYAIAILGITGMAVLGTTMVTREAAEDNIIEITAHTVAAGFLEQIKSMEYSALVNCIADPSIPLPTKINQGEDDPIYLGVFTEKVIPLNTDVDGNVTQSARISVKPTMENIHASTGLKLINIIITYKWDPGLAGISQEWSIRTARSNIPNS